MPKFDTLARAALETVRVTRGLTQRQIADAAGGTQPQVCDWLSGESRPNVSARLRLERAYPEVRFLDWLLDHELPSDPSDDASQPETAQAARTSSIPPRSDSEHASACPVEAA
jgi:transcriptional regulator with XRE-family HTH domain